MIFYQITKVTVFIDMYVNVTPEDKILNTVEQV